MRPVRNPSRTDRGEASHGRERSEPDGEDPQRHGDDEVQIHREIRPEDGQQPHHCHDGARGADDTSLYSRAYEECRADLCEASERTGTEEQRGEALRPKSAFDDRPKEVQRDTVERNVCKPTMGEDGRNPRPDVQRMPSREDEHRPPQRGRERNSEKKGKDEKLEPERHPHHREEQVGRVAAEETDNTAGGALTFNVSFRPVEHTSVGATAVPNGIVESGIEDTARIVPVRQSGTIVTLGKSMVGTERVPTPVTLVRHIFICTALVTLSHRFIIAKLVV